MNKGVFIITVLMIYVTAINAQFTEHEIDKTELFGEATAIETGDIDGDGDIDVFISHIDHPDPTLQSYFTWYENIDGEGTYIKREVMDTDNKINVIVPIDFDNDGDLDVVTSGLDNTVSWFENVDGAGSFTEHFVAYEGNGNDVGVIDFDTDNDNDIVFIAGNKLFLIENTGSGNFGTPQILYDGFDDEKLATSINVTDINNDTYPDILISIRTFSALGEVMLFKNIGSGTFASGTLVASLSSKAWSVKSLDIDIDGDEDFVIGYDDNVSWFENIDGSGNFGTEQIIDNIGSRNVQVSDIDSDGSPDLIVTSDDNIIWYQNTGSAFSSANLIYANALDAQMAIGDFIDNNSTKDIVFVSKTESKIGWFSNVDGTGNFGDINYIQCLSGNTEGISEDIDNDGDLDVLVSSYYKSQIIMYDNTDGLGSFNETVITSETNNPMFIALADIDNDFKNDLIVYNRGDESITWFPMIYLPKQIAIPNVIPVLSNLSLRDVDGDSDMDIVVSSYASSAVAWYKNTDGLGTFGSPNYIINGNAPIATNYSDINSDGKIDVLIALFDYNTNMYSYQVYLNDGVGNFALNQEINIGTAPDFEIYEKILGVDVDSDGDIDLLGSYYDASTDTPSFVWYENDGSGTFGSEHLITTDWMLFPFSNLVSTDIDNDGDMDIITNYRAPLGINSKITWYKNTDGNGTFNVGGEIPANPFSLSVGDYNNDNNIDLLSVDFEQIHWFENSGILSISDVSSNYFKVQPNPTTSKITIESEIEISEIIIYNQLGQEVLRTNNSNEVDLSSFDSAIYFCHILDINNNSSSLKIIKE